MNRQRMILIVPLSYLCEREKETTRERVNTEHEVEKRKRSNERERSREKREVLERQKGGQIVGFTPFGEEEEDTN